MKQRLRFPDALRGLNLLSMITYHGLYNVNYIYGHPMEWYRTSPGYIWQQSICWTFIFLSGFCLELGRPDLRHQIKRGLLLTACGLVITLVTALVMPSSLVVMGVLSFFGLAVLITALLKPILVRIPPAAGLIGSLLLFFLTREINAGYLGFEDLRLFRLPDFMYQGKLMMVLGFPYNGFYSTDYFSVLPWIFLFWSGFYCWKLLNQTNLLPVSFLQTYGCRPLEWIGRKTLIIYMLHQPVLMGICTVLDYAEIL